MKFRFTDWKIERWNLSILLDLGKFSFLSDLAFMVKAAVLNLVGSSPKKFQISYLELNLNN